MELRELTEKAAYLARELEENEQRARERDRELQEDVSEQARERTPEAAGPETTDGSKENETTSNAGQTVEAEWELRGKNLGEATKQNTTVRIVGKGEAQEAVRTTLQRRGWEEVERFAVIRIGTIMWSQHGQPTAVREAFEGDRDVVIVVVGATEAKAANEWLMGHARNAEAHVWVMGDANADETLIQVLEGVAVRLSAPFGGRSHVWRATVTEGINCPRDEGLTITSDDLCRMAERGELHDWNEALRIQLRVTGFELGNALSLIESKDREYGIITNSEKLARGMSAQGWSTKSVACNHGSADGCTTCWDKLTEDKKAKLPMKTVTVLGKGVAGKPATVTETRIRGIQATKLDNANPKLQITYKGCCLCCGTESCGGGDDMGCWRAPSSMSIMRAATPSDRNRIQGIRTTSRAMEDKDPVLQVMVIGSGATSATQLLQDRFDHEYSVSFDGINPVLALASEVTLEEMIDLSRKCDAAVLVIVANSWKELAHLRPTAWMMRKERPGLAVVWITESTRMSRGDLMSVGAPDWIDVQGSDVLIATEAAATLALRVEMARGAEDIHMEWVLTTQQSHEKEPSVRVQGTGSSAENLVEELEKR